ncbi:MAG: UDP-N-acetylmuramate dehydrogenase [Rikenellaceae bacterium]
MIRIFNNVSLRERNSFRVDCSTLRLVEFDSKEDLVEIFSANPPLKWLVLSGGNNILFTRDFEGTLLTPTSQSIEILNSEREESFVRVRVGAGVEWDDLVEWSVERDLWGIENLSLIPGKAGAAPIQNIGAYGVEVKDVIEEVEVFEVETLKSYSIQASECNFAYRDSIFKGELKGKVIVTSIVIRLEREPNPRVEYADVKARVESRGGFTLRNIRDVICEIRDSKLPDPKVTGNAGSFFKNPIVKRELCDRLLEQYLSMPNYPVSNDPSRVKLAAGWLIDQSGLKGAKDGKVGIHHAQALVVVNLGGASGSEILDFAHKVQRVVLDKFGVEIETEVNIL